MWQSSVITLYGEDDGLERAALTTAALYRQAE
jgi:hypothetical protein